MANQDVTGGFPNENTLADRYGAGVEKAGVRHTPGPWLAASRPSSVVGLPVVAQTGRSIASVTYFGLGENFREHNDECLANARLIAAAPELLDACMAVANALRDPSHEAGEAAIAKVKAAIAKATTPEPSHD